MVLKVVLQPGEDSGFVASVPALRGCWSQGATREEALTNIREAAAAWLEVAQDTIESTDQARDVELVNL